MARSGAKVILDEVFLEGATDQERRRAALEGLGGLWVGVRCDAGVAAARELARGDRLVGLAALQAPVVHEGVVYDLVVDTTGATPESVADLIAERVASLVARPGAARAIGQVPGTLRVTTSCRNRRTRSKSSHISAIPSSSTRETHIWELEGRAARGYRGEPEGREQPGAECCARVDPREDQRPRRGRPR